MHDWLCNEFGIWKYLREIKQIIDCRNSERTTLWIYLLEMANVPFDILT